MFYTVKLLDSDGCELTSDSVYSSLRDAKRAARYLISETEYLEAGARKVEVRNEKDVCIFDKFAF